MKYMKYMDIKDILLLIVSILIAILALFNIFISNTEDTDSVDISARIEAISDDLSKASSELSTVQKELEARIETVEKLKSEADIAENMISLSEEQVSAIQAKIHQEVNANSGKSLLQNVLVNSLFFFLGLVVQPVIRVIKKKFTKTKADNNTVAAQANKYSNEELEQAIKLLDTIKQQRDTD